MRIAAARRDPAGILAADVGAVVETLAGEHDVTAREVVEALAAAMRRFAPASAFSEVMKDITGWGEVTLIVHTDDGTMEFTGAIPPGEVGRGYFNLWRAPAFAGICAMTAAPASPSWNGRSWGGSRRRFCP